MQRVGTERDAFGRLDSRDNFYIKKIKIKKNLKKEITSITVADFFKLSEVLSRYMGNKVRTLRLVRQQSQV